MLYSEVFLLSPSFKNVSCSSFQIFWPSLLINGKRVQKSHLCDSCTAQLVLSDRTDTRHWWSNRRSTSLRGLRRAISGTWPLSALDPCSLCRGGFSQPAHFQTASSHHHRGIWRKRIGVAWLPVHRPHGEEPIRKPHGRDRSVLPNTNLKFEPLALNTKCLTSCCGPLDSLQRQRNKLEIASSSHGYAGLRVTTHNIPPKISRAEGPKLRYVAQPLPVEQGNSSLATSPTITLACRSWLRNSSVPKRNE